MSKKLKVIIKIVLEDEEDNNVEVIEEKNFDWLTQRVNELQGYMSLTDDNEDYFSDKHNFNKNRRRRKRR